MSLPRPCREIRGATAVEYAIVLPVLLLLLLGITDVGRLMWVQGTLEYATAAAARCAAVDQVACGSDAAVQSYAAARAYGLNLGAADVQVAAATCGRRVSASRSFGFVTPWITPTGLTLHADACYPPAPA
jgi:Flp pilus assembly protein TadG